MKRLISNRSITCTLLVALALALAACSGQGEAGSGGSPETTASAGNPAATPVAKGAKPVSALSGRKKADEVAQGWQQDAKLYSITADRVNEEGLSRSWNYAYVSRSAGAVSIITVSGDGASRNPERKLSEKDLEEISRNLLPENTKLVGSTEAMENSDKVEKYLKQNPDVRASMGLDSFSSERPSWILTVSQENLQEKIPATQSS